MIYLNKEETLWLEFPNKPDEIIIGNKRKRVGLYGEETVKEYTFLTLEEAWQLMQTLQDKLYLHEEVRVKRD